MDPTKDMDLKSLLISWRCENLYNLFKEEDIHIDDLKLIKHHHVTQLLQPFKMGVRIRFEYYLETWRNQMGIPLNAPEYTNPASSEKNLYYSQDHHYNKPWALAQHHTPNELIVPTSNILSNGDMQSPPQLAPYEGRASPEYPSTREGSPLLLASNELQMQMENPLAEVNTMDFLETTISTEPTIKRVQCPYNLAQILRKSGPKGYALIKYYKQYKEFTNVQRNQLIHIICHFYKEHEYHLSLLRSHELETEILQMFPTEKLYNYRTEKRGRIYIKYTNMKSYKRVRHKVGEDGGDITRRDQSLNVHRYATKSVEGFHPSVIKMEEFFHDA